MRVVSKVVSKVEADVSPACGTMVAVVEVELEGDVKGGGGDGGL
jgi:hypothetical protein